MEEKPGGVVRLVLDKVSIVGLGIMTVLIFMSIVLRYVFSIGFQWESELVICIFTYIVFLGIAIAYREDEHIAVQLLVNVLPPRLRRMLKIMSHVCTGLVMILVAAYGIPIIFGRIGQTLTPGLRIPRAYIYAALPLGTVFLLVEICGKLKRLRNRHDGARIIGLP